MKAAQDRVDYTVIRSPIDGIVGAKNVEIGAAVAPGQSLMTLVPNSGIYITANYKETQLGNVQVGQQVDIKVDAYKGVHVPRPRRRDRAGLAEHVLASSPRRTRPATS